MKKICSSHVKIGDKIKIISGDQKGIIGTIQSIFLKKSIVYVEGISPRIKTKKSSKDGESQKIEIQIPIHLSNVMLWDKDSNNASRIGYKTIENQKKRYFKKSGNLV